MRSPAQLLTLVNHWLRKRLLLRCRHEGDLAPVGFHHNILLRRQKYDGNAEGFREIFEPHIISFLICQRNSLCIHQNLTVLHKFLPDGVNGFVNSRLDHHGQKIRRHIDNDVGIIVLCNGLTLRSS